MLYSILIYGDEGLDERLPDSERRALLDKHRAFQVVHGESGRLGPTAQLHKTATAVTLRREGAATVVLDGPFAETKEQLLGFYLLECQTLDEAIEAAKMLPLGVAAIELRPVAWFRAGARPSQG